MAVWIDPQKIRFKISPHDDLARFAAGDWDIERRFKLEETVKYRSLVQRYSEGRPWEKTDLFAQAYARRIVKEPIRGESTMKGLLAQYYSRVDGMFEDLKANGFKANGALPKLLVGRGGETFIGNQGNHRLAMAHILKLHRFAGEIICRHRMA